MKFRRTVMMGAAMALVSTVNATDIGAADLVVEKILFISSNYLYPSDRGEIWIKVNRSIASIHPGCPGSSSENGYLVAAFADDIYAKQYVAGLLTAKAAGATIRVGIDDSRKNSRSMCFVSFYEMN